ncbi:hypothetical protein IKF20_00550 [Candidatus Saccharibacteria bacterium]|nr:hypothetical protein [Candidatus Saccharibacteria bacterium]
MNKDVIYIEPEDDITDIILKIENSKEKIVAIVPPKKAGVFRSVVNIKLISKTGATAEKTVVLVTVDPSIIKLAASAKIPVAKNLQSAPVIPEIAKNEDVDKTEKEDLIEEPDDITDAEEEKTDETAEKAEEESKKEEEEEKPKKKPAKKSDNKSGNKFVNWIKNHKKLSIAAGIGCLALVIFLVWAFVVAPAVDIVVAIKTDQKSFSESISFTDNINQENAEEGKFYLEQKKIDIPQEVTFEATGKKNLGEKATGSVTIKHKFSTEGNYPIESLTVNGLKFIANPTASISWDGKTVTECDNFKEGMSVDEVITWKEKNGCVKTLKVNVEAAEAGTKYNIDPSCGWLTLSGVGGCSETAVTGGTDNEVVIVQQSDVIKAQNELTSAKEEEVKQKLYDSIGDDYYIIDVSFEQSASAVTVSPAADEEVKEGVKPSLKMTTSASVYTIDKIKLEQFINKKANLEDDQKIYEIKNIYVENASQVKPGSTNKLKAQYYVGPKITEGELVEKIKGKGLGDAQREIREVYGVSDVEINRSFPWVMSIPNDLNKIHVKFEIKDQNGNGVEQNQNQDSDQKNNEKKES